MSCCYSWLPYCFSASRIIHTKLSYPIHRQQNHLLTLLVCSRGHCLCTLLSVRITVCAHYCLCTLLSVRITVCAHYWLRFTVFCFTADRLHSLSLPALPPACPVPCLPLPALSLLHNRTEPAAAADASLKGCVLTRRSASLAFSRKHRSMLSIDILEDLANAVEDMFPTDEMICQTPMHSPMP